VVPPVPADVLGAESSPDDVVVGAEAVVGEDTGDEVEVVGVVDTEFVVEGVVDDCEVDVDEVGVEVVVDVEGDDSVVVVEVVEVEEVVDCTEEEEVVSDCVEVVDTEEEDVVVVVVVVAGTEVVVVCVCVSDIVKWRGLGRYRSTM
jgi:hypothetical protein